MKTTILLPLISLFLFLASCTNPSDKKVNDQTSESSESGVTSTDWQSRYDKLEASDLPDNVIQLIGKEWMLVTAGDESSFNTMTASWGGMGYIWERNFTGNYRPQHPVTDATRHLHLFGSAHCPAGATLCPTDTGSRPL